MIRLDRLVSACHAARLIVAVAVCCSLYAHSAAQNVQYTRGSVDAGARGDLKVNPVTHALELQVPLGGYPGRGGTALPVHLRYSSRVWRIAYGGYANPPGYQPFTTTSAQFSEHSVAGWTSSLGVPYLEARGNDAYTNYGTARHGCQLQGNDHQGYTGDGGCKFIDRITVHMPDGSAHEMRSSDAPYVPGTYPLPDILVAVDGSRLKYQRSTGTLFLPDGSRYVLGTGSQPYDVTGTKQYIDRNGNTLTRTAAGWVDTLGRTINFNYGPSRDQFNYRLAGDVTVTLPGVNGTSKTYIFRWRNLADVRTDASQVLHYVTDSACRPGHNPGSYTPSLFTSTSDTQVCGPATFNPVVLYQIELPNNQAYTFTYNVYGETDKIVYPTGGYERFVHGQVNAASWSSGPFYQGNRGVLDRYVSVDGTNASEARWQYPREQVSTTDAFKQTEITPDGTRTERLMHRSATADTWSFEDARTGFPYDERVYNAAGQMIRRKLTEWVRSGPSPACIPQFNNCNATRDPRPVKQVDIVLDTGGDALASTTTFEYDTNAATFTNLNVTATNRYAFAGVDQTMAQTGAIASMPAGALLRREETSYEYGADYLARNMTSLPASSRIKNGAGTIIAESKISYDEAAYPLLTYGAVTGWTDPGTTARGLPTTTKVWLDTTNTWIETHAQYDTLGNVRETIDARGAVSKVEYDAAYRAYPTKTTSPIPDPTNTYGANTALVTTSVYDPSTGLVTSTTDANNQTTSYEYNDVLGRLTKVTRPDDGVTTYTYGDVPGNTYVNTRSSIDATRLTDAYTYTDGLGRPVRSFMNEFGSWIVTATEYDALGRVSRVSNPYRSTQGSEGAIPANAEWTTTTYDALGRVTKVTTPDGAQVVTAYSGNTVTVTDQAGKVRKSETDSLGRLAKVTEAPGVASFDFETNYTYDVLGNLRTVTQGTQTRTFAYDSLSRLTAATNPESGTTSYTYDANSNLLTRTDARGVVTSYAYDTLNRVKTRSYAGGGAAQTFPAYYFYDGRSVSGGVTNSLGRLTAAEAQGLSRTVYTGYDAMGRVTSSQQGTAGVFYNFAYEYDLAGNLTKQTYPSGRVVETAYDAAGRMNSVTGSKGSTTTLYASVAATDGYHAHGAVKHLKLGNGLWESTAYNSRLQLTTTSLGASAGATGLWSVTNAYGVRTNGTLDQTKNNGNVESQSLSAPGLAQLTQSYTYDALNRIATAGEAGGGTAWSQTYTYDRYGNRTATGVGENPTISADTNRITGGKYLYDAAGNLTKDKDGVAITYDGENRQASYGEAGYAYDADGRRVKKTWAGTTTVFVYDAGGHLVAEYGGAATQAGDTSYLTQDHLGSTRVVTDASGQVKSRRDYLPFGEEVAAGVGGRTTAQGYGGSDGNRKKWATYERDDETGLDFAQARYYSPAQGRFTSPDEFTGGPDELFDFADDAADNPTFYADLGNPQSLNKYQYAYNNPLRYNDPNGHCPICPTIDQLSRTPAAQELIRAAAPYVIAAAATVVAAVAASQSRPGDFVGDDCRSCRDNSKFGSYGTENQTQRSQAQDQNGSANQGNTGNQEAKDRQVDSVQGSSRSARREAMRGQKIPTSQQPDRQSGDSRTGRSYDYTPGRTGRGRGQTVTNDPRSRSGDNKHGPHWEAGRSKSDGRRDPQGRTRIQNEDRGRRKSRVGY